MSLCCTIAYVQCATLEWHPRLGPPQSAAQNLAQAQIYILIPSLLLSQSHSCGPKLFTMSTMFERVYEYFIFEDLEITKLVCAPLEVWNLKGTKLGISKHAACSDVEADFNVKVDKKNIRIHKVCLRKISPVFDAMMIADESKDTFHFDDFNFSTVRNALRFMFSEDVTEFLTTDQVYDIIRFAKKYEFYHYEKIIIFCTKVDTLIPLLRDLYLTDEIVKKTLPKTVVEDYISYPENCYSFTEIARMPKFRELDEVIKSDFLKQCCIEERKHTEEKEKTSKFYATIYYVFLILLFIELFCTIFWITGPYDVGCRALNMLGKFEHDVVNYLTTLYNSQNEES